MVAVMKARTRDRLSRSQRGTAVRGGTLRRLRYLLIVCAAQAYEPSSELSVSVTLMESLSGCGARLSVRSTSRYFRLA